MSRPARPPAAHQAPKAVEGTQPARADGMTAHERNGFRAQITLVVALPARSRQKVETLHTCRARRLDLVPEMQVSQRHSFGSLRLEGRLQVVLRRPHSDD